MKGGLDISPWHHRQKPAPLSMITLILFGVICVAAGFGLGNYLVEQEAREAIELFDQLSAENERLSRQVDALKQQQSILESGSKIDRLSVSQIQNKLSEMHATHRELKEKLAFYQRIMAPEKINEALYIQDFRLLKIPGSSNFKFMLTLSQGVGKKRAIKGSISLWVVGQLDGENRELQLKELIDAPKSSLPFSFRYFQTISSDLTFPEGFVPESLSIKVKPSNKGAEAVEREWDWKSLIEAGL